MTSIEQRNQVHPTAIISKKAIIGSNNVIGPYCTVYDNVEIGDNNIFTSHVSIGSLAEHKTATEFSGLVIGSRNVFREFITINAGTTSDTKIGSHGYFMRGTHFGHDCQIMDHVTLACNSIVGGHTIIMDYANIGLGAITHQKIIIPPGCMLGMGAIATKAHYAEWSIYVGNPAKFKKRNDVGFERANLTPEQLSELHVKYNKVSIAARADHYK